MVCKWINVCGLRRLEKEKIISFKWKEKYCLSEDKWEECERFKMEDKGIEHENILPDGSSIK
ncbi:MAG: uracil-DNA glycosylase [Nanobdellota archaeon]